MTAYYIAFSIHGTNRFIVAGLDRRTAFTEEELNRFGFRQVISRMPTDGIKLHWSKLNCQRTSQPLRCPSRVLTRFRELLGLPDQEGIWIVEKTRFIQHHFRGQFGHV